MKPNTLLDSFEYDISRFDPEGAGTDWIGRLGEIAASGSHYAMSHQAMRLFSATGSNDVDAALAHASRLADLAQDREIRTTRDAAEALEGALVSYECCDAMQVKHACADLIGDMVERRLINTIPCRSAPSH
ncbi:hypothetical protein IM816_08620 [Luteibacter flocculans]|uniref:Uncharacterized protein n=1 Tax=Luteibacter flocculans TaxID=2780091 RepID=A0ABY4T7D8_9GAMM|nr:hypothetical protein [Luteibacter flocculans]URL60124.1 hypothetical protein IM816_08620 [Luteibacter flocculans]